jgi:hypothetical protein
MAAEQLLSGVAQAESETPAFDDWIKRRFQVVEAGEIIARKPRRALINGVLGERDFAILLGASGSAKTHLALSMACASRLDAAWFGRRIRPCQWVFVNAEGNLTPRVQATLKHRGLQPEALDGLFFIDSGFNLLGPDSETDTLILRLQMLRAERGELGVVVIDTLSRVLVGGDENDARDMTLAIEAIQRIQHSIDCAVLVVHHLGKDTARGARGHSSLYAAADSVLTVERERGGDTRTLTATKMRDGADGSVLLTFRLQSVDLGALLELDPDSGADPSERVSSCVVVEADQAEDSEPVRRVIGRVQQAVIDHLAAAGSPITRAQLVHLMKADGYTNPSSTYKAIDALLRAGLIVEGMHRLYLPDTATQQAGS